MKHLDKIIIVSVYVIALALVLYFYFIAMQGTQLRVHEQKQNNNKQYKKIFLPLPDIIISDVDRAIVSAVNCDRVKKPEQLTCTATLEYEVQEVK